MWQAENTGGTAEHPLFGICCAPLRYSDPQPSILRRFAQQGSPRGFLVYVPRFGSQKSRLRSAQPSEITTPITICPPRSPPRFQPSASRALRRSVLQRLRRALLARHDDARAESTGGGLEGV
eukprot:9386600-Pyramimonas_sp.AAC.1